MNSWTARYLKIRSCVLYMANPFFYVIAYGLAFFIMGLSGRDGFFTNAVIGLWHLMKDISSWVFLAGTGEHQPDVHLIVTVLLPSFIAFAWWSVEKMTGVRGYLERRGLVDPQ